MRLFAYCAHGFRESVRQAAGVEPFTCPPLTADDFQPAWLEGHDYVYFKLHGLPGQPYWYGDTYQTAIAAEQVRAADLSSSVVFVANCYLAGSPMLAALQAAGARAVIGGSGANYARVSNVGGADLLGLWIRRWLQMGASVSKAMTLSRRVLQLRMRVSQGLERMALADALEFEVYA